MKLVIVIIFPSLFALVVASPLHGKSHAMHHLRRSLVTTTSVSQVEKTIVLIQTAYCTASQKQTETVSFSSDNPATNSGHDGVVTATSIRHSASELTSTVPGATISDECTQSFPCSDDITNYDPSIGIRHDGSSEQRHGG